MTVVGPGGIGKTRLAVEAAATLVPEPDGAWFVDLAPVRDPALVPDTIAAAVGVHAEGGRAVLDLLLDRLGSRSVLLVLDHLEHLLASAADLARLLAGCPRLRLLATSRSVLHLRGEHDLSLAPLTLPAAPDLEAVAASQSVELLLQRAQQVRPGFALTPGNAPAVAELVRLTEGTPLAVELVAARLRLLSPQALLTRLGDRLDLRATDVDAPRRQQTLRATIDWSHDLPDDDERALLARLSVCAAGWGLEAVEALGADLDTLSALVGHSPVSLDERDLTSPASRCPSRCGPTPPSGWPSGEVDDARERFSRHLTGWSERAGEGLQGPDNRRPGGRRRRAHVRPRRPGRGTARDQLSGIS